MFRKTYPEAPVLQGYSYVLKKKKVETNDFLPILIGMGLLVMVGVVVYWKRRN